MYIIIKKLIKITYLGSWHRGICPVTMMVQHKLIFFKKIRQFITVEAAEVIYKGTILPIIEYADFVFDHDIKYVNRKFQSLQNQGLYTVFNQHYLPYNQRESTETLHRRANIIRLDHRRKLHMLSFMFNYRNDLDLLDVRNLPTRRHDGLLFKEIDIEYPKVKQDPFYRAIRAWNNLPVDIRNINTKELFKNSVITNIPNPFKKIV